MRGIKNPYSVRRPMLYEQLKVRTVCRGQQHVNYEASVQCTEADVM